MNKCTLLIDGNWLLMSRYVMNKEAFLKTNSDLEKDMAMHECVDTMMHSISYVVSRFEGIVDNVILVCDGKSWRKDIKKPASLEADYKGTRIKDEEIDYERVFGSLKLLEEEITKRGFTVSHTMNAEGDDAIWYWKNYLNYNNVNCIIWASDNDLKQLVSYDNKVFTIWYNDKYGLFADEKAETKGDELDLFMQDAVSSGTNFLLESIASQGETNLNYINPENIIMEKIICGDKSDNIKAVVRIVKNEKTYSVTPKMWNEVKEKMEIETLNDFFANVNNIITELRKIKKFQGTELTVNDCLEQFEYNSKLVWLDDSTIPKEVQEEIACTQYFYNSDIDLLKITDTAATNEEAEQLLPF